jgi:hypothetical protein
VSWSEIPGQAASDYCDAQQVVAKSRYEVLGEGAHRLAHSSVQRIKFKVGFAFGHFVFYPFVLRNRN